MPDAAVPISIKLTGPAKLLGIDNGEMTGPIDYASPDRSTAHGRALAIIQSTDAAGAVVAEATSPGLDSASVTIDSKSDH